MGNVVVFLLAVLLANVSGWGACIETYRDLSAGGSGCFCSNSEDCNCGTSWGARYCRDICTALGVTNCYQYSNGCRNGELYAYYVYCTTGNELDSAKCVLNPSLPECQQAKDTTLTICLTQKNSLGGYVSNIHRCSCKANNGEIYQCNGKSNVDINNDCPIVRTIQGTCSENGYPNGEPTDSSGTSAECYAVTGSTCHMRDRASGNTFRCECDGSCDYAQRKLASGECVNPYPPPQTGNDSLDLPLPEQPPQSSGSEPPQSSGATCDNCSALQAIQANTQDIMESNRAIESYTQTTMDNTTDIKNGLTEMAIDVSHIRTATENIDLTTQGIDRKLSNTNSLLNDIKNKNWNPTINVQAPEVNIGGDTIIVNADTAKAPSEILGFLKGVLGGMDTSNNYSESDTLGSGTEESNLRQRIDSLSNEGMPNLHDSLPHAVTGVKGALTAFKDSLNRGPYADSLRVWENSLLNNGVITGSGSNDCPAPLTRNFSWNFGSKIGTIQLGSLRFICEDALGLGFSLWTLARTILRAMVAICCMLWIYREVTGTGGGSNDED